MSDQPPYPSGGWNHNWFGSPSSASPDTGFSAPPPTQGSGIPGGYRPYPVEMQNAADGQYGWAPESGSGSTQPLSQLPEGNVGGGGGGRGGDPNVRTPYTPAEIEKMFEAYVSVSEDVAVGTNQSGRQFWERVCNIYNANRPAGTVERNQSMLRNAIGRASEDIQKFQGFFLEEQRSAGSGSSEADIITGAMMVFQTITHKAFRHLNTWKKVRHMSKWSGGTQSSSGSTGKRSRSLSDVGEDEVASQLAGAQLDSSDAGPSGSRRRPQGTKAARAARRRAPSQSQPAAPAPVPPPPAIPPNPNTLFGYLERAINADQSRMTPEQRAANTKMIEALQVQLGILPPPTGPPPDV